MSKPPASEPPLVRRPGHLLEQVLAAARRAAAHDVNNLLAILRGNLQLLPMVSAVDAPELLAEMDLACARLALACDEWQLADPSPVLPGISCGVGEVVTEVMDLLRNATDVQVRLLAPAHAIGGSCAMDARTLRAVLYVTMRTVARAGAGAPLEIGLARVRQCSVLTLRTPCTPDRIPVVLAPAKMVRASQDQMPRLNVGLWDASMTLRACGGALAIRHEAAVLRVRLRLPALAPG